MKRKWREDQVLLSEIQNFKKDKIILSKFKEFLEKNPALYEIFRRR
jgi:hypothetical protein